MPPNRSDQQAIVEEDRRPIRHASLLVREVWVAELGDRGLVPITEDTTQLGLGRAQPTRHDHRCAPQVDEADLAAIVDPPPVTERCRKRRLATLGDSRS